MLSCYRCATCGHKFSSFKSSTKSRSWMYQFKIRKMQNFGKFLIGSEMGCQILLLICMFWNTHTPFIEVCIQFRTFITSIFVKITIISYIVWTSEKHTLDQIWYPFTYPYIDTNSLIGIQYRGYTHRTTDQYFCLW